MTSLISYTEKYYPYAWVILFFISYLIFYPENWMITDAYNYVNRGIAFSLGSSQLQTIDFLNNSAINLIPAPYNTGTSVLFGVIIKILGKKSIFLVPLFQVIISFVLLTKTIQRNNYSLLGLATWGLSLSLLFFSRSAMSCIPSLLLVSIACYFFFKTKLKPIDSLCLGFTAALSLWFRESNIFLIAPFILHTLYKNRSSIMYIVPGIFLGLSPKILMDKWVYDTYWFTSASSGFSIHSLVDHLPEYSIILIILLPLSIIFIMLFQGKGDKSVKVASVAFIFLYLFYNYSAVDFSGLLKGSFLTSRFMIPLLPIVAICAAEVLSRLLVWKKVFAVFALLSLIVIPSSQFIFHFMYNDHQKASKEVSIFLQDKEVIADFSGYTNIIRYYNPLTAEVKNIASIQHLKSVKELQKNQFVLLSRSIASEEKQMRADSIASLKNHLSLDLIKKSKIDQYNWLEIYDKKAP